MLNHFNTQGAIVAIASKNIGGCVLGCPDCALMDSDILQFAIEQRTLGLMKAIDGRFECSNEGRAGCCPISPE